MGALLRILTGLFKNKKTRKWMIVSTLIIGVMLIVLITSIVVSISGTNSISKKLASWIILMREEEKEAEEEEKNWQWDPYENSGTGDTTVNSGIYPKDPVLKNWALYFEYNAQAKQAAGSKVPIWEYIGLGFQESSTNIPSTLNDSSFDISKDLVTSIFCQGNRGWSKEEHFLSGGTMYNDFPKNDPNINHALGPCQFDQNGIAGKLLVFGNPTVNGNSWYIDETLGFTRPNAWYLPDCIQSFYNKYALSMSTVEGLSGFSSLSDSNKDFLYAVAAHANYNMGSASKIKTDLQTLADAGNSGVDLYGAVNNTSMVGSIWKSDKQTTSGGFNSSDRKSEAASALGVTFSSSYTGKYVIAAWAGKLCYDDMLQKISNAEKEGGGVSSGDGISNPGASSDICTMANYVFNQVRSEGFGYKQASTTSSTFGTFRPDCSGMTTLILNQLGLVSTKVGYSSSSYLANAMNFTVVSSWDELQPGDIVAWTGHVCIYAGNNSWYSWGSEDSATRDPIPDPSYHSYAQRMYNSRNHIILRAK